MARIRFDLRWDSATARHCDSLIAPRLNLWRDLLPPELEPDLMDRPRGHRAERRFAPGELVPQFDPRRLVSVPNERFDRGFLGRGYVQPRRGRFYPKAILRDLGKVAGGSFQSDQSPCRLTEIDGERIGVDFNHPLAERPLTLSATIESIWSAGDEHGGRCNEVAELVTANGPGMQARWRDLPTDFWSDRPYLRTDEGPDPDFYREPRLVDHLDRTAIGEIGALYGRLIEPGARILDLMSSWHSHLPEPLCRGEVVGLGMNALELAQNPALAERVVQDLNAHPVLPFADGAFDAAVCTVSVEYLTRPFEVFRELARVLKPGAPLVVAFSNRWFPPKAIRLWEALHEFERPGLVLEYFLESGRFEGLETWSLRGLPRPADDKYADRLALSDPVYAVWGLKAGPR
jgi:SAM-dependent methyltransferase